MPRPITLQEFLSGENTVAIKKYKMTGILPSYVVKPKKKPKIGRIAPKTKPGLKRLLLERLKPKKYTTDVLEQRKKAKEKRRKELLKKLREDRKKKPRELPRNIHKPMGYLGRPKKARRLTGG